MLRIRERTVRRWRKVVLLSVVVGSQDRLMLRCTKLFPLQLVPSRIPVNKLVGIQIIFGDVGIFPSRQEILVKGSVETSRVLVVPKHIFRHADLAVLELFRSFQLLPT